MFKTPSAFASFPGLKALFALAAFVTLFAAGPAYARSHVHPADNGYEVDFQDLDLETFAGRNELMSRLITASLPLCEEDNPTKGERDRCVLRSVRAALATAPQSVQQAMRETSMIELARR
jgi:UrcA family protein